MANVLNYKEPGGAKTVIEGTLEIGPNATLDVKTGATVEGLGVVPLPVAAADTLGCVKVGTGLAIADEVLSVQTASADQLGGVKVGTGLAIADDGVLSANIPDAGADTKGLVKAAANVADSEATALADLVTSFNALLSALKTAGIMVADSAES